MLGIELDRFCGALVKQALDAGILTNVTNDTVIRLLPPLIIDEAQAKLLVDGLSSVIKAFLATSDSPQMVRR
jgi:acetylornithine aminotransferase